MEANTTSETTAASRPIGLSEALAAGAPLSWTETVAVVRDVAMHLHWSATPLNVPTLAQIAILPNGSVQIEGGRPNPAGPVAGLAGLMEQLLDSTGCPQQLLDVQKQARATPSGVRLAPGTPRGTGILRAPGFARRTRCLLQGGVDRT